MELILGTIQKASTFLSGISVTNRLVEGVKYIGTHDGTFHADEVTACVFLKLLPKFKEYHIIRTRDDVLLNQCEIIVDVGGKFDGIKFYDHHQKEFNETFSSDFTTKLSSSGLIYRKFGKEIINEYNNTVSDIDCNDIYVKLYKEFIEHIDAIDNGISITPNPAEAKYHISTDLPSMISRQQGTLYRNHKLPTDDEVNHLFKQCMVISLSDFYSFIDYYTNDYVNDKQIFIKDFNTMLCSEMDNILILTNSYPWKSLLLEYEKSIDKFGHTKFAIYQDNNTWRVQTVPVQQGSFLFRKSILPDCSGLRDNELCEMSGIEGCIFVHRNGFIGGNNTKEGAIQMALKSLNY